MDNESGCLELLEPIITPNIVGRFSAPVDSQSIEAI